VVRARQPECRLLSVQGNIDAQRLSELHNKAVAQAWEVLTPWPCYDRHSRVTGEIATGQQLNDSCVYGV
jgi:hypothetical protein